MKKEHFAYSIHEVAPYIHWSYFFHAWGFPSRFSTIAEIHHCNGCRTIWLESFPEEERPRAAEATKLYKDACAMLNELDTHCSAHALFRLCEAYADGDDLLLDGLRVPLLRQQKRKDDSTYFLCLSDFVPPVNTGDADYVGVFVASISSEFEHLYAEDAYKSMLIHTLADRLAEATVERMHEHVRRNSSWGYSPDERLTVEQLHRCEYQGIRPAVGYPSLPDQSVNFLLDILLDFSNIAVSLTENGAMTPHSSVSGLMFSHPSARYFSIGQISREQLTDYARRRGMPLAEMEKFLRPLL